MTRLFHQWRISSQFDNSRIPGAEIVRLVQEWRDIVTHGFATAESRPRPHWEAFFSGLTLPSCLWKMNGNNVKANVSSSELKEVQPDIRVWPFSWWLRIYTCVCMCIHTHTHIYCLFTQWPDYINETRQPLLNNPWSISMRSGFYNPNFETKKRPLKTIPQV